MRELTLASLAVVEGRTASHNSPAINATWSE